MSSDDTAVIIVVVLQASLDLLDGALGSSSGTGVTSGVEGREVIGVEAERVSHVSEVADEERMTIPEIQTENSVSCVSVVSVMHVPYGVHPELAAGVSVCPCETKKNNLENRF
jgi:hypothetical protein